MNSGDRAHAQELAGKLEDNDIGFGKPSSISYLRSYEKALQAAEEREERLRESGALVQDLYLRIFGGDWSPSSETCFAEVDRALVERRKLAAENKELRERERGLREALEQYRREEAEAKEWEALRRESDVRCVYCGLRYGEREQYGCEGDHGTHYYVLSELAAAREALSDTEGER